MPNFTTRKTFLIPSFDIDKKEREKLDRFLLLLERSGVNQFLLQRNEMNTSGGRPQYSSYNLFATILYGFAFGSSLKRTGRILQI